MKYYARYAGIPYADIAIFKSKKERDNWVLYKDKESVMYDYRNEEETPERESVDRFSAEALLHNKGIRFVCDEINPDITWARLFDWMKNNKHIKGGDQEWIDYCWTRQGMNSCEMIPSLETT